MKLKLTNPNYCATVSLIEEIGPIPGADRIVLARVMGSNVIVSKGSKVGDAGLFFPAGTALSSAISESNNLYRKPEYNADPAAKAGMFDLGGRVKAIKLKGVISEGFFLPLPDSLAGVGIGTSFNEINGVSICTKYLPINFSSSQKFARQSKKASARDNIVEGQFKFHCDTDRLSRNHHAIDAFSLITITKKYHGTSAVVGRLLVKKKLSLLAKLAKLVGVQVAESEYQTVWSSRRVVKGVSGPLDDKLHFYGEDVWGYWAKKIENKIPNGVTLYGEIVGFTPGGKAIQPSYSYYQSRGDSRFMVYRITHTSSDGFVSEFSQPQIEAFCFARNICFVECLYYGEAGVYVQEFSDEEALGKDLDTHLKALAAEGTDPANPGMPQEGFVVSVERHSGREFYKSKNPDFLVYESKQADAGEVDTETAEELQSVEEENGTISQ